VSVPADGPVSWTAREDAAAAAALVLLADEPFDGPVTMTASEAPTFAEVAQMLSEQAGRDIAFEVVDEEEWVARAVQGGQPEQMVRFLLGMYQAAAQGYFAGTDPLLRDLLGREPVTAREVVAGMVAGEQAH
jgi:NAD(P)H dehydrogenase (quinone)